MSQKSATSIHGTAPSCVCLGAPADATLDFSVSVSLNAYQPSLPYPLLLQHAYPNPSSYSTFF